MLVRRRRALTSWQHSAKDHAIPAIYSSREFPEVGGLMSYGTNLSEIYRQVGTYAGRRDVDPRQRVGETFLTWDMTKGTLVDPRPWPSSPHFRGSIFESIL
jgi:hypothetical protein